MTSGDLVDILVELLKAGTKAAQVEAYRDWPVKAPHPDQITIDLPEEQKEGMGRLGPGQFNTTAAITVRGFVCVTASGGVGQDGGAQALRQRLVAFAREIEVAVINAPALMGVIQQIKSVETKMKGDSPDSGYVLGQVGMQFHIEFYQGEEDFAQPETDDLDEVEATIKSPTGATLAITDIPTN